MFALLGKLWAPQLKTVNVANSFYSLARATLTMYPNAMHISFWRGLATALIGFFISATVAADDLKRVEISSFGKSSDGAEVKLVTLKNSKGMRVQVISYGAIIKEILAPDRDGKFTNVVLSTDSMDKYERFPGSAAVIGRVANRIAGAQFDLDGAT